MRQVEIYPVKQGAQEVLCLRDPLGAADQVVTVTPGALALLECLDGKHDLHAIHGRLAHRTKQAVSLDQIERFIAQLDEALLLESPRFNARQKELLREFRVAPVRRAAHAGRSYPARATELQKLLAGHFTAPGGPRNGAAPHPQPVGALVAPHIDIRRGGATFAWAYDQLRQGTAFDLFVVLGVAHVPTRHRFVGTTKHFETPLGTVATDTAFMAGLARRLPFEFYADELAHRREHSIEFQLLYLQHVLGARTDYQIAPILVGSFHDLMEAGRLPGKDEQVAAFVRALQQAIADAGRKVCVIAGVDLAHIGGRFGDEFTVNETVREQLEAEDRDMLAPVVAGDPLRFCGHIYNEDNRRRVDGFPAVFTMLSALEPGHGELLHYGQSFEPETNSVVSFASLRFW